MDAGPMIAFGSFLVLLISSLGGYIHRVSAKLDGRFTALDKKVDSIKDSVEKKLDEHELRDQSRHEDNLQRLTRLETLAGNGNGKSRVRASR